jgi:hypothetical protein
MNIIELGNKAGLPACHTTHPKALERFAALVAAHEREECALLCINIANKPSNVILGVAIDCASAIRERSNT